MKMITPSYKNVKIALGKLASPVLEFIKMPPAGIGALIFDLDDTIAPERDYVISGFKEASSFMAKKYGVNEKACFEKMKFLFESNHKMRIFDRITQELKLESSAIPELVKVYRTHSPGSVYQMYPDCAVNLSLLAMKYECALLSDGYYPTQEKKIRALGLKTFFSHIEVNHSPRFFKPHRRGYEKIMKSFGLPPESFLVIGDNPLKDFISPLELGMMTVRIRRGGVYGKRIGHACSRARYSIANMNELWKLIIHLETGNQCCQGDGRFG